MRHISKNYDTAVVKQYQTELSANKLDENSLLDPTIHSGLTGRHLYKQIKNPKIVPSFKDLKDQMYDEQGGICCYCGLKIYHKGIGGREMSVEHVVPKGVHRELVGEYKNLLLSCKISNDDISLLGVTSHSDPGLMHCDNKKGDNLLIYTPLNTNCEELFTYDIVGNVTGINNDVNDDINTLGLNCSLLTMRRKVALSGILFDAEGNVLSDIELETISNTIMQRDVNNRFREFCFVIKQVADSLRCQ